MQCNARCDVTIYRTRKIVTFYDHDMIKQFKQACPGTPETCLVMTSQNVVSTGRSCTARPSGDSQCMSVQQQQVQSVAAVVGSEEYCETQRETYVRDLSE